jgi:hypothetical protein
MSSHQKTNEFLIAVRTGDYDHVSNLLDYYGKNLLNSQDHFGSSALHIAIMYDHHNVVRLLLSQPGININLQAYEESIMGNTYSPIDVAIKYHQPIEMVQLLLDSGATTKYPSMLFYMLFQESLFSSQTQYIEKINRPLFEQALDIFDRLRKKIPEIAYIDGIPLAVALQEVSGRLIDPSDKVLIKKMIDNLLIDDLNDYTALYVSAKNFTHAFPSDASYFTINKVSKELFESEGHVLAFAVKSFHDAVIDYQEILNNNEGALANYTDLKKQVFSEINASLAIAEKATLHAGLYDTSKMLYQLYDEGKTILLPSGWDGHAVDVVLDKSLGLYIVTNAGERYTGLTSGVNAYQNNMPISVEDIYKILNNNEQYDLEYKHYYDLSLSKNDDFSQVFPDQEYGNCALNSLLLANWSLLSIQLYKKLNNLTLAKELTELWHKDITEHHKTLVLEDYLSKPYMKNDLILYDTLIMHEAKLDHHEKIIQTNLILDYLTSSDHIIAFNNFYKKKQAEFSPELKHFIEHYLDDKIKYTADLLPNIQVKTGFESYAESFSDVSIYPHSEGRGIDLALSYTGSYTELFC